MRAEKGGCEAAEGLKSSAANGGLLSPSIKAAAFHWGVSACPCAALPQRCVCGSEEERRLSSRVGS